jgi:hypothetical protein
VAVVLALGLVVVTGPAVVLGLGGPVCLPLRP